jgi:hypothetical protein
MIKWRLIQIVNPILRIFGYEIMRMGQYDPETWEVIYHPWKLEKLKK